MYEQVFSLLVGLLVKGPERCLNEILNSVEYQTDGPWSGGDWDGGHQGDVLKPGCDLETIRRYMPRWVQMVRETASMTLRWLMHGCAAADCHRIVSQSKDLNTIIAQSSSNIPHAYPDSSAALDLAMAVTSLCHTAPELMQPSVSCIVGGLHTLFGTSDNMHESEFLEY
jgi:hypothetical protein